MQHEQADATPDVRVIVEGMPPFWHRRYQGEGVWVLLEDYAADEPDLQVVDLLLRRYGQPRRGRPTTDRLRARAYWRGTTREEVTEVTPAVRARWACEDYESALARVSRTREIMTVHAAHLAQAGHADEEIHNLLGPEDDITAAIAAGHERGRRQEEIQSHLEAEPLAQWERELLG